MATYLINIHVLAPEGTTAKLLVPNHQGLRLSVMPGNAAVILAEAGPHGGMVVSHGSPVGAAGQAITISGQIKVSRGPTSGEQGFAVLDLDGSALGLVSKDDQTGDLLDGADPVVLEIKAVQRPAPGTTGPYRQLMIPDAGQATSAKPRKNALAFALGTLIDTPDGPRRVETLTPGDLVTTLDNGSQPLRWAGQRRVTPAEMALREDLQPLRLEAGVLGNERVLLISPRHRILLNDWRAQVYFGEDQVLVPAQALINGVTVRQVLPLAGVTYMHLLFDRHEVILSEGALSESFHPGGTGFGALDAAQRQEIEVLFPGEALERRRAAFPMLRMAEARALRLPG